MPFRQAFGMWQNGQWFDPGFFHYPSLTLYLNEILIVLYTQLGIVLGHFAGSEEAWLQLTVDPSPVVKLSRSLNILADLATMLGVYRLARRRGAVASLVSVALVAFSATMIGQSRLIIVEPVMTALLVWSVERLACFLRERKTRFWVQALVLGGLAAGAKYNAGLIAIPILLLAVHCFRRKAWWWAPLSLALSLAVFLATSPYVILDFSGFVEGFRFEAEHMSTGHFGTEGRHGAVFAWKTLAENLLFMGIPMLLFWAWQTARNRVPRLGPDGLILSLLLPFLLSIMAFKMEAARYLVPVIPLAAMGVGSAVQDGLDARRNGAFPLPVALWGVFLTLFIGGGLVTGFREAREGKDSTQILARRWIEQNIGQDSLIVQEGYGPALFTDKARRKILADEKCRKVHPAILTSLEARPVYQSITLPFSASGAMTLTDPVRGTTYPLFSHISDFNGCYYDASVFVGADFFITSGGVRQRYTGAPGRFARQTRFYSWLEAHAELVHVTSPGAWTSGPEIRVYSLPGSVPSLHGTEMTSRVPWWASTIRMELIDSMGMVGGTLNRGFLVQNLAPYFEGQIMPFLVSMARFCFADGKFQAAAGYADQILEVLPSQRIALAMSCRARLALGQPEPALLAVERGLARTKVEGRLQDQGWLLLERANLLAGTGNAVAARKDLESILSDGSSRAELRRFAQKMWRDLGFADP